MRIHITSYYFSWVTFSVSKMSSQVPKLVWLRLFLSPNRIARLLFLTPRCKCVLLNSEYYFHSENLFSDWYSIGFTGIGWQAYRAEQDSCIAFRFACSFHTEWTSASSKSSKVLLCWLSWIIEKWKSGLSSALKFLRARAGKNAQTRKWSPLKATNSLA